MSTFTGNKAVGGTAASVERVEAPRAEMAATLAPAQSPPLVVTQDLQRAASATTAEPAVTHWEAGCTTMAKLHSPASRLISQTTRLSPDWGGSGGEGGNAFGGYGGTGELGAGATVVTPRPATAATGISTASRAGVASTLTKRGIWF